MNFAHSSSLKSVFEWFLLAEQIIICHYYEKRLVSFEKKKKTNQQTTQPCQINLVIFTVHKVSLAIEISLTDVLLKPLSLHFKLYTGSSIYNFHYL